MDKTPESRGLEFPSEEVLRRIRIPFIRRATIEGAGGPYDVFLIDLGLLGVFVEHAAPIEAGATVTLRFSFPDNDRPVVARCRVAWWQPAKARVAVPAAVRALPAGAGLEFVGMSDADE